MRNETSRLQRVSKVICHLSVQSSFSVKWVIGMARFSSSEASPFCELPAKSHFRKVRCRQVEVAANPVSRKLDAQAPGSPGHAEVTVPPGGRLVASAGVKKAAPKERTASCTAHNSHETPKAVLWLSEVPVKP